MKIRHAIASVIFISLLISSLSHAEAIPANFPKDLLYKGQPINPFCFADFFYTNNKKDTMDLKKCEKKLKKSNLVVTTRDEERIKQGYVGYDYDQKPNHGYSYYKPYGSVNGGQIIYLIHSGGGSGQFSSLYLVTRTKNKIQLETLASGDRCNGGVLDVKQDGQKLTYTVNLTAYDFLDLAQNNPHNLNAYADLEACAACCKATAIFERELDHLNDAKLFYIDLTAYPIEAKNIAQQGTYQVCFDKLLLDAESSGKKYYDTDELKKFTQMFNDQCVKE